MSRPCARLIQAIRRALFRRAEAERQYLEFEAALFESEHAIRTKELSEGNDDAE